ncbi:MAG: DNA repair protein RecN [Filifactoraceae bacterium]
MLRELYIKNFALINELRINFESGLNIITGETGSGKSIMIDALSLCLGGRGERGFIKQGEKKAVVEAVFFTENKEVLNLLEENGIDVEENVIIYRELCENGPSTSRINSRSVNLTLVREVTKYLLNIHGQSDYNLLYDRTNQLGLIDSFGGDTTKDAIREYEYLYKEYKIILEKMKDLKIHKNPLEIQREKDFLESIINDIDSLNVKADELDMLEDKLTTLKNAEKIFIAVENAHQYLYSMDSSVLSNLDRAVKGIVSINEYYSDCEGWVKSLEEAYYQIEDITREMGNIKDKLVYDERLLDSIHERISRIVTIYKKYGGSYETMYIEYENSKRELDKLQNLDELKEKMNILLLEKERALNSRGEILRNLRKESAKQIESLIISELESLAMPKVSFTIDFKNSPISSNGLDEVDFLISFNKGEEAKPMAKIASGGETSRFMLSLKSVISKYDSIDSLLFDEIDTGVSGLAAENIGKKLKEISKIRQVICITHLPQIASCANVHFKVEKVEGGDRTNTTIEILDIEHRQIELAKMMSGSRLTDISLNNAKELLELNQD